ncbi:MAG: enoyl-[acyl-carrier protein] reductase [Thermoleophilaceae bacterium]|jgi:enoyl-[acyl-carrier protein] reductase II|nr:enoyl-[acyl-carrier protein] reductase [Thermoleophilaceae bacterium]
MPNRVAELLGVEIPIVQAPMTFIANAELAGAVSNAGALGIIETTSPKGREDLLRVREYTDRPVGANIALKLRTDPAIVQTVHDAGIRVVTTSAGDPNLLTGELHDAGITVFHVVGTLRAAMKALDAGVDGVVAEGVEGGGFKHAQGPSTMVLVPLLASRLDIPIIAAGGICDARSMAAAMVLGAEGVQMGTRMLSSEESTVHQAFKDAVVANDDTGTLLISPPGLPTMRVLRTNRAEQAELAEDAAKGLMAVQDLYFRGEMEASLANLGQVSSRVHEILPVAEIIAGMWSGVQDELNSARQRIGTPGS